ncbi:MAG: hypothetical protein EXR69_07715 [Myxococcales bacterium]|nr:hypothetical protein [Myxococcales bacterium]
MTRTATASRPQNIVLLIADSLRYDSVHPDGLPVGLPYTAGHATRFTQARSGGCWTLPATASLFTGLMPHEHGADTHSRGLGRGVPTLAAVLRDHGYSTHQITANVATTDVFGLDAGFDEIYRIWKEVPAVHRKIHEVMVLIGKPRLRKKILSTEFITGKLSEDLEASKVWLQSTIDAVFDRARATLAANTASGKGSFLFLNLMETHFPYHVAPTFETTSQGWFDQIREVLALYHLVNQTWLTRDRNPIADRQMAVLRERQRESWRFVAARVDAFVQEIREAGDNLVIFGSDHGDCFGEQGWSYHFSNVADAGNRVPLYWLRTDGSGAGRVIDTPVSARDVFHGVLREVGDPRGVHHITEEPERSLPVMESAWYNNQGKTLQRYRYDQIAFVEGGQRFLNRQGGWWTAAAATVGPEPVFEPLPSGVDPIEDAVVPERRAALRETVSAFRGFATEHGG